MDHATSASPAVQAQLDRLTMLSPGADVLGLERIAALLDRLGDPQHRLPPVFHVAGTNGKGSTCAYLRAVLEAAGHRVHAYTSPHLVRFNERIRIAGTLIDDDTLAPLLARVLDHADGLGASFFEVTTAAALLLFAETPADACVLEVGLGGRLDATNVVADPAACGIAQLGIDHEAFLGSDAAGIAREKAGIARAGRPLVTLAYPAPIAAAVAEVADAAGAPIFAQRRDWDFALTADRVTYRDPTRTIDMPRPALPGEHQAGNLALAVAMLCRQDRVAVPPHAFSQGAAAARWPARMQRLGDGPLTRVLARGTPVWLDGGHNPAAAGAVAATLAAQAGGARVHLIVGMLANKDARGFLAPFAPVAASLTAVPVAGHAHHAPDDLAAIAAAVGIDARAAPSLEVALRGVPPGPVAVIGSLYLAGEALLQNDELPD